jgi:hypothetical protein
MWSRVSILCFSIAIAVNSYAQKPNLPSLPNLKDSNLVRTMIKLFKGKPNPLIDSTSITINKVIKTLADQEGKQINSIKIEHRHHGSLLFNESNPKEDLLTQLADKAHSNTKENTIQKNLFFKENDYLNPLVIAYNEKWLRDLPYLQDARIIAYPLIGDSNKVDVYVITKDIFPFGGSINLKTANSYKASLNIENLNDMGNDIKLNHDYDAQRSNKTGWGFNYTARNIGGSFMEVNTGLNTYESNYANNINSANRFYINGLRPLLNPLSKFTAGFDFSVSNNNNAYPSLWTDSLYKSDLQYKLTHFDTWIGYQLFNNSWQLSNNKPRHFIQFRILNNKFDSRPNNYLSIIDKNFQNINAYLVAYTLFTQKIIRTQYLYGFGRNEDLPSGKALTITTGHYKREGQDQPYAGLQIENYRLAKNESFRHVLFSTGTSYSDKELQDVRILLNMEQISKLKYLESGYKYRSIFTISLAETLKNKFNEALLINSIYGIPQLSRERIKGGTRLSANWESIWYNSKSYYGFRQAPFVFGNITYIRTVGSPVNSGDIYSAIGGGSRVRNENLIFGTIEIKGFYFPRTNLQLSPWNISLTSNLRFKYNSSIITKPDFVQIN